MSSPLIQAQGAAHRFGAVLALRPTDLSVAPGEFLTLLGPSGCGKTTLLRILAGLITPTEGRVERSAGMSGYVFQRPVLLPWRSALDNVLLPVQVHGRVRRDDVTRAHELLDLVGLTGFARHRPDQLSGGMQQRVALARALIERPQILFMDEPFSALDEILREEMNLELLRVFQHEPNLAAAVLVTHSIEEAVFLSDRVVVLGRHPGHVIGVVDIDVPRPRTLGHKDTERFHACVSTLRRLLRAAKA